MHKTKLFAHSRDQNTDEIAIATLNEKLDLELSDHDVDRIHRTGTGTPTRTKQRPVLWSLLGKLTRIKYLLISKG